MGHLKFRALLALSIFAGPVSGQDAGILAPGSSIQDRIDRLPAAGGVLELGPGVHEVGQPIRLRNGLILRGAGTKTVLRAMAGRSIPLLATGDFDAGVSNVQALSLALDGHSRAQSYTANDWGKRWSATNLASVDNVGIYLKRSRGIVLSNIRFDDFLNEGIMAVACSNLALLDCLFTNCCQEGSPRNDFAQGAVYLRATTDSRFIGNRLFGCFEGGIVVGFASDRNRLIGNLSEDSPSGEGFLIGAASDNLFLGNTVRRSSHRGKGTGAGISISCPVDDKAKFPAARNRILSNLIEHTGGPGITVMKADATYLEGNVIAWANENRNPNQGGIKAYQSDSLRILSNTLRETASGAAIVLHGTKDVVVKGNRFSGNPEDLQKIGEVAGQIE